jgi:hypothetical protein
MVDVGTFGLLGNGGGHARQTSGWTRANHGIGWVRDANGPGQIPGMGIRVRHET